VTYELIFDRKALEFLESASMQERQRIYSKLLQAKEKPFHFFKRLTGRKDYSLRIGDYRAIADIDTRLRKIEVSLIDHRKRVYDELP
jgi:mRNA-degrading endonuclease RelE of RelBE toxin-antitoxin system